MCLFYPVDCSCVVHRHVLWCDCVPRSIRCPVCNMGPVLAISGSGWTMYSVSIISLYLLQRRAPSVNIARPTSCRCRHDQQMNPWPSSSSVPMQSVATGGRSDTCSTTHAVHTNMLTLLKMLVSIHSFQSPVTLHQLKILLIFMAYRLCSEQPTTHRTGYCVHYCRSPQARVPYFIHYLHCMKLFKMKVSDRGFISIMCIVCSPVSG